MKLILFTLFLLTSSLYSAISEFKKEDYQILIGDNFNDEAFDIIEDYDYAISVIGYSQDFQTSTHTNTSFTDAFSYLHSIEENNGEQLRIIKLDSKAAITHDKRFSLKNYNRGTNILKTVQNGYIIGGYTHNGQMIISRLDASAQPKYLKQFGTANFDQLHSLISFPDGGTLAIGTSQTSRNPSDDMFVQGLGRSDVYLVKYKRNGEVRWKKKYGSINKDIGVDGVATGDGGFILLGISQEANEFRLSCAKINDTGDIVWMKKFPKLGRQKAFKIIKTIRGNYLISASYENKNNQDNIRLIKIDNEGNRLWEKNYFANAHEHLNDINEDLHGNIIGVGYSQAEQQGNLDALVRYYNHNGEMLWEKKFGKNKHDSFKAVSLLHDNTFAIAGFSTSFANKKRQIWVLKLNDDGSFVKKNIKRYKKLYDALVYEFRNTPKVHIYKDLRITHKGLIFKQGSSTLTNKHKAILQSFMPRFLRILSIYKKDINNLRINGYTSTEWNTPNTQRYLNNAKLSNDRSMHVLNYSYQLQNVKKYQSWITKILSIDGYSYSNLIYANKKENKIRSRRVEFEINLK